MFQCTFSLWFLFYIGIYCSHSGISGDYPTFEELVLAVRTRLLMCNASCWGHSLNRFFVQMYLVWLWGWYNICLQRSVSPVCIVMSFSRLCERMLTCACDDRFRWWLQQTAVQTQWTWPPRPRPPHTTSTASTPPRPRRLCLVRPLPPPTTTRCTITRTPHSTRHNRSTSLYVNMFFEKMKHL